MAMVMPAIVSVEVGIIRQPIKDPKWFKGAKKDKNG